MTKNKKYDLEERTLKFAQDVNLFIKGLAKNLQNIENGKQLIRSAGSVGANYIEANEALSKKDFIMRVKISRKEAKESIFWLKIVEVEECLKSERERLIDESTQLMKIFGSIIEKSK
ncbi:four helix bundle protein [candidate division WS5 bacterium]|uniref:Four helix bundle protein n=1 Tax=candidate division WS5 bacterium TaxID=2093353 RepID=A0A419DGK8_9BACT|nr:MAG: four helix bundle protein [candidate division WS5 bacterium]